MLVYIESSCADRGRVIPADIEGKLGPYTEYSRGLYQRSVSTHHWSTQQTTGHTNTVHTQRSGTVVVVC